MSAQRFKPIKTRVAHPLPKRNRNEARLLRIGASLKNQWQLDSHVARVTRTEAERAALIEVLTPYLRFTPNGATAAA